MHRLRLPLFALLALLVLGATSPCISAEEPEDGLIPRSVLFGNPDRAAVRISPDGTAISYLAEVDGVMNVWVAPREDLSAARAVTHDEGRGIRRYSWAFDNRHLIYMQDAKGDENWRLYALDLVTHGVRDLTPMAGVQARIVQTSRKFPQEILVGLNDRNPRLHDIHRVNIVTGERTLVEENPGFVGYVTDEDFNVRLAGRVLPDGSSEYVRRAEDGTWQPLLKISQEDTMTTNVLGFMGSSNKVFVLDSRERDTAALMLLDLDTGDSELIAEDARADIGGVMQHPIDGHAEAVSVNYLRPEWRLLDPKLQPHFDALGKVDTGELMSVRRSMDDAHWIAVFLQDAGPVRYYLYDTKTKTAAYLFSNRKDLEGQPLVPLHPVVIPSRDGLKLVSYLSLPKGSCPEGTERPQAPLPMVLLVHGGPWSRDSWGFNNLHQLLANRGYAVLSVNFRGSTGFGKSFLNAANKEWGAKMHDDLIDAVQWAVDEKIADPAKVAIMGGSYGGYATLVGLTFTPERFACGVDIVGPSSLVTLLESVPPYWMPILNIFTSRVGDHRTEEGRKLLTERSPLTHVDKIKRPLLIGQGKNDPRVKEAEAEQIVRAMQERKIPVTYVLYPDEGHGFTRPQNSLSFFAITEAFLAKVLGGRAEPFGGDLEGASLEVRTGAEDVPGLPAALEAIAGDER